MGRGKHKSRSFSSQPVPLALHGNLGSRSLCLFPEGTKRWEARDRSKGNPTRERREIKLELDWSTSSSALVAKMGLLVSKRGNNLGMEQMTWTSDRSILGLSAGHFEHVALEIKLKEMAYGSMKHHGRTNDGRRGQDWLFNDGWFPCEREYENRFFHVGDRCEYVNVWMCGCVCLMWWRCMWRWKGGFLLSHKQVVFAKGRPWPHPLKVYHLKPQYTEYFINCQG